MSVNNFINSSEVVAAYCVGCLVGTFSSVLGIPPNDLLAAFVGSFLSLAFIKPHHWGEWINYTTTENRKLETFFWLRRTFLVAFILLANAVVAACAAQFLPSLHDYEYLSSIHSEMLSLLLAAVGQAFAPRIFSGPKQARTKT